MMYSDRDIRHAVHQNILGIEPWNAELVQPASVDVRLGSQFKVRVEHRPGRRCVDLSAPEELEYMKYHDEIILEPGMFALGHTEETFTLSDKIVGRLEGKSSIARLGLLVHVSAGFIDPGFCGQITLELANVGPDVLVLRKGIRIGQMSFMETISRSIVPYGSPSLGSKYQGQHGAQEARWTA